MPTLHAAQCRAARGLLDWTQADLASKTRLSVLTVRNFEKGAETRDSNRILIRMALEEAGIEFIPQNGGGIGLRFRASDGA